MATAIDRRNSTSSSNGEGSSNSHNKKHSEQTTVVELDSNSADFQAQPTNRSSEDLVIQKPSSHAHMHSTTHADNSHSRLRNMSRQGARSTSYHEEDLEAAHPPMEISVEQRYEIGPSAAGRLDSPRGSERPWSSGWPGAGYGNRVHIAAEKGER